MPFQKASRTDRLRLSPVLVWLSGGSATLGLSQNSRRFHVVVVYPYVSLSGT